MIIPQIIPIKKEPKKNGITPVRGIKNPKPKNNSTSPQPIPCFFVITYKNQVITVHTMAVISESGIILA